jgi:hypothetical protein
MPPSCGAGYQKDLRLTLTGVAVEKPLLLKKLWQPRDGKCPPKENVV